MSTLCTELSIMLIFTIYTMFTMVSARSPPMGKRCTQWCFILRAWDKGTKLLSCDRCVSVPLASCKCPVYSSPRGVFDIFLKRVDGYIRGGYMWNTFSKGVIFQRWDNFFRFPGNLWSYTNRTVFEVRFLIFYGGLEEKRGLYTRGNFNLIHY